ncbi:MAG: SMP-30/gluconolactonase/LRE family protein [Betaproteobacteria bacterium]|nr:SMP-30/gluconolactonase/LRE family protein [Betaproteobacteria bacterium]
MSRAGRKSRRSSCARSPRADAEPPALSIRRCRPHFCGRHAVDLQRQRIKERRIAMHERISSRPLQLGTRIAAAALACLGFGVLGAVPASAANQGQSRKVTMQDICGQCTPEKFTQCGDFLEGPAFDHDGNLWMVSIESGEIQKVSPNGHCVTATNTHGQPQGLKFAKDGRLFGVDRKRGVFWIDTATGKVHDYMRYFQNENFHGPNDLIIDKDGGIYFTDPWGTSVLNSRGSVYYISPEPEKRITRIANNLAFPNGIALSPDQKTLYINDFDNQRVIATPLISPGELNIGFAHVFGGTLAGGWGPDGEAVDANGNLYVAHYGAGEVVVIDPDGFMVGSIALPNDAGNQTTNVAFHNGYLYITEAGQNVVWRVKTNIPGAKLAGDQ